MITFQLEKGKDVIEVTILDDGTIKTSSNKVSMPNHANADQFLRDIARLAGGEVTRQKKSGTKGHVHAGVYHEH